jgi:pyruvate dehydrogenase E1 component alpha subunit
VGAAWAFQQRSEPNIAIAFFGDGCFEEGVTHECMNFAALKQLPVLFVCENNGYSVYTKLSARQPARELTAVAQAHTWQTWATDGNDVLAVAEIATQAVENARAGRGPQFIELTTHRWREHCGPNEDDDLGYRDQGELAAWKNKCPLQQLLNRLTHRGIMNSSVLEHMESSIEREINNAFTYALESPFPSPETLTRFLYAANP